MVDLGAIPPQRVPDFDTRKAFLARISAGDSHEAAAVAVGSDWLTFAQLATREPGFAGEYESACRALGAPGVMDRLHEVAREKRLAEEPGGLAAEVQLLSGSDAARPLVPRV